MLFKNTFRRYRQDSALFESLTQIFLCFICNILHALCLQKKIKHKNFIVRDTALIKLARFIKDGQIILNRPKALYLFALLGAMVIVPNYPYIVGIGYCIMHVMCYFQFANENRSHEFSATLPIKRADIVSATTLIIVLCQTLNFIAAAIFAYPSKLINPNGGNFVGLDCNFAFFGVALIALAYSTPLLFRVILKRLLNTV